MSTFQLRLTRMHWSAGGGGGLWKVTLTDVDSCRMTAKWALFPLPKEAWCCERLAASSPSGATVSQSACRNAFATTETCSGGSMTDPPALQCVARTCLVACSSTFYTAGDCNFCFSHDFKGLGPNVRELVVRVRDPRGMHCGYRSPMNTSSTRTSVCVLDCLTAYMWHVSHESTSELKALVKRVALISLCPQTPPLCHVYCRRVTNPDGAVLYVSMTHH